MIQKASVFVKPLRKSKEVLFIRTSRYCKRKLSFNFILLILEPVKDTLFSSTFTKSLERNLPKTQMAVTYSKLKIASWRRSGVFTVNVEHISRLVLMFLC